MPKSSITDEQARAILIAWERVPVCGARRKYGAVKGLADRFGVNVWTLRHLLYDPRRWRAAKALRRAGRNGTERATSAARRVLTREQVRAIRRAYKALPASPDNPTRKARGAVKSLTRQFDLPLSRVYHVLYGAHWRE